MGYLEQTVSMLASAGISTELIVQSNGDTDVDVGVRLRPFGRKLPKNKMIIASGSTFEEALRNAVGKAESRRWEALDWAARPWETPTPTLLAGAFGLDDASGSWRS